MKTVMAMVLMFLSADSYSQLALIPDRAPQRFFSGERRRITEIWTNAGDKPLTLELRARLYQASSSTAGPLGDMPSKKLELLPHQTVLESTCLDFPPVRAATEFVLQWLEGRNHVAGTTRLRVYPANLLAELKPISAGEPLGVFDPENLLKPLLQVSEVGFHDLELNERFSGKLAIFGPFESRSPASAGIERQVKRLAHNGASVLWIVPAQDSNDQLIPSFYLIPCGKGQVIVAQSSLVANLSADPQAQLNLLHLARFARNPYPLTWPLAQKD